MTKNWCEGRMGRTVLKGHLGSQQTELRGRVAQPGAGERTMFGDARSLTFDENFFTMCDTWSRNMNWWFHQHSSYDPGDLVIDWIGEVGTVNCGRSSAAHNSARGLDLCQIRFTNGYLMDSNWSHSGSRFHRRRYLGVAAHLRMHFGIVLTSWYDYNHRDHIHFDNTQSHTKIRTSYRSDTVLIQAACNLINDGSLTIDGGWGRKTQAAYESLLDACGLECLDPTGNRIDAQRLLAQITKCGLSNEDAGYQAWTGCK